MYRGYFALYRKIKDHPFYKEKRVFSKYEAWIDLLMDARHKKKPKQIVIGMRTIECGYGQCIKSLRTMGERWGWTAKKVSRFLNLLENMGQIRHENVTVTTRITILNYSKYDMTGNICDIDMPRNGNTRETQGKHEWGTNKHDKHDKHLKNENNISTEIKNFVADYQKYASDTFGPSANKVTDSLISKGSDIIDKLVRLDGFTFTEISDAIIWASTDDFWASQIKSLASLRKKSRNGMTKFQNLFDSFNKKSKTTGSEITDHNLAAAREFLNGR